MKNFINICKMTQPEVKNYMKNYLEVNDYTVINEDGFLYAKGTVPVLLVAHMDTIHKQQCTQVIDNNGKLSSPQGIGGDDRCGVFIISEIIKELHCSVLLCEDEEIGTVGARKFAKTDYIDNLDVNYMIEFDRKGNNDAVFYKCDNEEFTEFVTRATDFKVAYGSFSDISVLAPAANVSAVNLSSGYYNAHTTWEHVIWTEVLDTIDAAMELIKTECEKPFEYVEKQYRWSSGATNWRQSSFFDYDYNRSSYDGGYSGSMWDSWDNRVAKSALEDTDIELEVLIPNDLEVEKAIYVSGKTKADCWMKFFIGNPDICFNDIVTYSFT